MQVGRTMSVGARAERMLAARLAALERRLDTVKDDEADTVWAEYYVAVDLCLRTRFPVSTGTPPITKAMLEQRFKHHELQ